LLIIGFCAGAALGQLPGPADGGYYLPNGWTITPVGTPVRVADHPLNIVPSPDGKVMVALHCGYNPHGIVTIDAETNEVVQTIPLPTAWFGLAWHPHGSMLYVSGGNNRAEEGIRAPIYVFTYADGRLSDTPVATFTDSIEPKEIFWTGLAHHPSKPVLYAANRTAHEIAVFNSESGAIEAKIATEQNPYDLVLSEDGSTLYCSNWGSDSISVIDTSTNTVVRTIAVGDNPSDMVLSEDGRIFVCCANDNTVAVVDTAKGRATETIVTSLFERAPEGSTPNALALDLASDTLYVANADNNNVCVVEVEDPGESTVLGFIPAGWYPCSVAVSPAGNRLYIGNAKGNAAASNIRGPHSPLPAGDEGKGTVKSLMKGTINIVDLDANQQNLRQLTQQAYANCPYNDELLVEARPPAAGGTLVPSKVGVRSPINHVIYIIKENRTYDQVFGDLPQGNGDPRLAIFGREVTPNHHALVEQFVLLDNIYCDAEVSRDGHSWSNAAYATDFIEKNWPALYAGKTEYPRSLAMVPGAGYLWDQCKRKGLTYRTYGEFAWPVSEGEAMEANEDAPGLMGHVAPNYLSWGARDYENAAEFIREFEDYDANFDSPNSEKRFPNYVVVALPEDHTKGTSPGAPTPRAAVASNDYGLGMIVERVSHSKYWPETAIFVIQDDAQDGPDHVDARRTVGMVISPYCKRGIVDSTHYTTSSMLRTMELLLGLQPMSQFDAAATPMYACFSDTPDLSPYTHLEANIDLEERNEPTAWGAQESSEMDLSDYDRAPMFALNEIVWKSVKGADSEMPLPVHRFHRASLRQKLSASRP
jgi:YVTN family beta-propeller protein